MKKWARVSLLAGIFLLATALIWSIAAGKPVWEELIDACGDENGCAVWSGDSSDDE